MSLKRLSYNTAQKIIDKYSELLMKERRTYQKLGYSELQGYDVFDIDNALKLQLAYFVFNSDPSNDKEKALLDKYANENDAGVQHFFLHFVPDEIVPFLDNVDPNDPDSVLKAIKLERAYEDTKMWERFQNQETHTSFLKFCLSVGRKDIDYWGKVYSRLNLVFDERDPKDHIYICIKEKELFHRYHNGTIEAKPKKVNTEKNTDNQNGFIGFIKSLFKSGKS